VAAGQAEAAAPSPVDWWTFWFTIARGHGWFAPHSFPRTLVTVVGRILRSVSLNPTLEQIRRPLVRDVAARRKRFQRRNGRLSFRGGRRDSCPAPAVCVGDQELDRVVRCGVAGLGNPTQ